MCAALLGGGWWVLPVIGFAICAGFMLVAAFRFGRTGRGCMCMGGSRSTTNDLGQPGPGVNPASR